MGIEQGPQFFPEEEEHIEEVSPEKVETKEKRNKKKGAIKKVAGKVVRRAALGAAIGITMLPGSKDAPSIEFQRGGIPLDSHHAPVPYDFDVPQHPEKGLVENLPRGIERVPDGQEKEPPEQKEPPKQEEKIDEEETPEIKEKEVFEPRVTIIDAGLEAPKEGIRQETFFSNEEMMKQVLGDQYISKEQLEQEFGKDLDRKWGEIVQKYPAAMMHAFSDRYFGHGESVADVMHKTWDTIGMEGKNVELIPFQPIFDKESVRFVKDSLGNPGISVTFDEKRIIELLEENTNRIVNLSFQVGDVEIFLEQRRKEPPPLEELMAFYGEDENKIYVGGNLTTAIRDGNVVYVDPQGNEVSPMTREEFGKFKKDREAEALRNAPIVEAETPEWKINGAYTEEKAETNLPRLFEICRAYPEKLFVVAGGNNGEDIREAREQLQDQWPDNLMLVGQWWEGVDSSRPANEVYGMDMYVHHTAGMPEGSIYSTAALSAVIDASLKRGSLSGKPDEIIGKFKGMATPREYTVDEIDQDALVFGKEQLVSR